MPYFQKNIIITERQIKPLLKGIILENRESKNLHNARVYLRSNGIDEDKAKKVLNGIRHDIPNSRLAQCKFLVGICRYFLKNELDIMKMNSILPFISNETHVNEYDSDFNGLPFETLYNQFKTIKDKSSEESRKQSYNRTDLKRNPDYKIYKISSGEEAEKFSNYTTWCVTKSDDAYDAYTNDGMGMFYFCVKNGFESIEKPSNESSNPLDEYGLSMIAISVDEDGDLNTCTSRWNHDNDGNDHIMSKDDIEDLLGVNFYETFKPRYTKEEIERINREKDDKVRNLIKEIIKYDEFNDNAYYHDKKNELFIQKNVLENGDIKYLVNSKFYDHKWKIFNPDLSLFSNKKILYIYDLPKKNGFIANYNDNEYNILLLNGSLLLGHNAYEIRRVENFICIQMSENSRYEIYDYNFNKVTDKTFDDASYINNENFLKVYYGDLCNILSLNGSLLLEDGADAIIDYTHFLCVKLSENSKYEIYDYNFKKITNETFDYVDESSGFLIINKKNNWNIMDANGNYILNKNYNRIYDIQNFKGYLFFTVKNGDKYNVFNRLGQRLFYDGVNDIRLGFDIISYHQNGNIRHISYEEAIKRMR